jgi:hypothetical protein
MLSLVEFFTAGDVGYSSIGNKFGDIYEAQLESAMSSRLNKDPVPKYYQKYMKPVMNMYPSTAKL